MYIGGLFKRTMSKESAGILLYRLRKDMTEVFLVHPGGPYWAHKDIGVWSIPKGEFTEEEDALEAAKREFREETGHEVNGNALPLDPVKQKNGKWVYAWAVNMDMDAAAIKSNFFEMEWPPRSGKKQQFPEIDKAGWFSIKEAGEKINSGQKPLLDELVLMVKPSKVKG